MAVLRDAPLIFVAVPIFLLGVVVGGFVMWWAQ
jgi:hypothetical protein